MSGLERPARTENPENVAMRGLGFLSMRGPLFERFLKTGNLPTGAFARRPISDELALAVLDFLIADEVTLLDFVMRTDITVEAVYFARRVFMAREDGATDPRDTLALASVTRIFDAVREPPAVEAGWATHARRLPQVSGGKSGV